MPIPSAPERDQGPQRFVFVCGSLEPALDPIGDHVRLLGEALHARGHCVGLLALNDRHLSGCWRDRDAIVSGIPIQRLGSDVRWRKRMHQAARFAGNMQPDWVSLHYAPAAFHELGLPFRLAGRLRRIAGRRPWHVMFHELWLGLAADVRPPHRLLGSLQRRIVRHLLRTLKPARIHTPSTPNAEALRRLATDPVRLPLFATLPIPDPPPAYAGPPHQRADRTLRAGVFGPIPPDWDPLAHLLQLADWAVAHHCQFEFWLIGHTGHHASDLCAGIRGALNDSVRVMHAGTESANHAALAIAGLDIGFAPAPWPLIEQSSTAATCLDLGVPVVVTRDGGSKSTRPPWQIPARPHLHPPYHRSVDWDSILNSRQPPRTGVPAFVDAFLADLGRAPQRA
jgi:hypothetical protein